MNLIIANLGGKIRHVIWEKNLNSDHSDCWRNWRNIPKAIIKRLYWQNGKSCRSKGFDHGFRSFLKKYCHLHPSSIYSWFLKPLSLLHSWFPTKISWVVAYFFNFLKKKKKIIKSILFNFGLEFANFFSTHFSWPHYPGKIQNYTRTNFSHSRSEQLW